MSHKHELLVSGVFYLIFSDNTLCTKSESKSANMSIIIIQKPFRHLYRNGEKDTLLIFFMKEAKNINLR